MKTVISRNCNYVFTPELILVCGIPGTFEDEVADMMLKEKGIEEVVEPVVETQAEPEN